MKPQDEPLETLATYCAQCGNVLPSSSANFCPACGAAVQPPPKSPFQSFQSRWLLLVLIVSIVVAAIGGAISEDLVGYLITLVLSIWVAWVIGTKKISVGRLVGRVPSGYNWWPIALMAMAGVAYSVGALPVILYPLAQLDPEFAGGFLTETPVGSRIHFFILAVILAPLVEETMFRGLLFSRLTMKWGMTRAIITSSALFGLLHLDPIGAFVFGVVACVLYVRTQTLMVPMVLHALTNLIVVGLTFTETEGEVAYTSPDFWGGLVYQGLVAMLLASPVVFTLLGRWWPSRGAQLPYDANQTLEQQLPLANGG